MTGRSITSTRLVLTWLIVSVGLVGVARAVALPEACEATNSLQRRESVQAAIGWIAGNQGANGRFLYRYDAVDDVIEPGYNWVRHAGTMLALEQARVAGFTGTEQALFAARKAIASQLVVVDDADGSRAGVLDGRNVSTGGTALFLLAITEPMTVGEIDADDVEVARSLARHLVNAIHVGDDGVTRVREVVDSSLNFSRDSVGPFTTGEVAFALARMERLFPGEGWGEPISGIVDYLVRRKAVEEGFVPDMSDHWAAYAFAETTWWTTPRPFDAVTDSWARKQMGIASVMIRYESQLTNQFPDHALRGSTAVGAAVGTHGEAMAGWTSYFASKHGFDDELVRSGMARLACNNGTLVSRQVDATAARSFSRPRNVEGAWLSGGVTQVDDQQHSMSAIIMGDRLFGDSIDPRPARRQPIDWSWSLVLVGAFVVASPARWGRALTRSRKPMRRDLMLFTVTASMLGLFAMSLLEAIDVSVPTAAVATGVVVVVSSLTTLAGVGRQEKAFMAVVRPELVFLVLTCSASSRMWPLAAGLLAAYALAEWLSHHDDDVLSWAVRIESMTAVAIGVAFIVNGVYSI